MPETKDIAIPTGGSDAFFQKLSAPELQEKAGIVRALTHDVMMIEANQGRLVLELGRKLRTIRDMLEGSGVTGAWKFWCDTFVFTKDYANRMIQCADIFNESMPGVSDLSFRHLREIARLGPADKNGIEQLVKLAQENQLSAHTTRKLVTELNAKHLSLEEVLAINPTAKDQVDSLIENARNAGVAQSQTKVTELLSKVEDNAKRSAELEVQLKSKNSETEKLQKEITKQTAIEKLGDGDPELGTLRMKLEQMEQDRDNTRLALETTQKDLRKSQTELDSIKNSPTGQAKQDLKKAFQDIEKFFKDTMTPAYLAMRIDGVGSPEAKAQGLKLAEALEVWTKQLRERV